MHMDLDLLNGPSEVWLNSTECATNVLANTKNQIQSKECYCIRYDLFEPSCEEIVNDFIQIGKYRGEDNNFYRYTSMYFFGSEFKSMLIEASEIEVTFDLNYDSPAYLGNNADNNKDIFNNNIILRGHSFESQDELMRKWNDEDGYDELKYHFNCPFTATVYDDLRAALIDKKKSFSITLNESIIREFDKYNVKGLHLYCHDNINGSLRIGTVCTVKVTKLKNFYDDILFSKEAFRVKDKHIYDEDIFYAGSPRSHAFFLFEDDFTKALNIAEELEVTLNFGWYNPSRKATLINTNINFINDDIENNTVILSGHGFRNGEELNKCNTKNELFETDKNNYCIEVFSSFKKALEEGRSTYTFVLKKDDIDMFKLRDTKGLRIGFKDNGVGHWKMSKTCSIKITKYKEDYSSYYVPSTNPSWFNINENSYIGHKLNKDNGNHAVFYFFNNTLYNYLNFKRVQNVTVRFYFNYDSLEDLDDNINVRYVMCAHNFYDVNEALEFGSMPKANGICEFHITEKVPYKDIILTKDQINFLKNYTGLCFYSKNNTSFTAHGSVLSIFVDYIELEECTSIREFDPLETKTFIVEDKMTYDKKFICGSTDIGYLYKPFMYLGDNFNDFMRKNEIVAVKILIAADHINYYDERPSAKLLNNICFYTHDISTNVNNYESYKYKEKLFETSLGNSKYVEIDLDAEKIDLLKTSYGLGAIVDNNVNNDFLVIDSFKIIVTYVNIS